MPQRPLEPLIRNLETESQLGDDEREAVRQLPFTVRNIPAGGDIVRERENPSQCCLVLEGWLCRHKITLEGARQIFSFHIAGDIPDLQSLHLKTMDHTLSSVTPSTVALIQHDDLRALDAAFPRLGDILWRDTLIDAAIFREWINRDRPSRSAPEDRAPPMRAFRQDASRWPDERKQLPISAHAVGSGRCPWAFNRSY